MNFLTVGATGPRVLRKQPPRFGLVHDILATKLTEAQKQAIQAAAVNPSQKTWAKEREVLKSITQDPLFEKPYVIYANQPVAGHYLVATGEDVPKIRARIREKNWDDEEKAVYGKLPGLEAYLEEAQNDGRFHLIA